MLHKLVVNGLDKLSPLYNCFLTIICNLSPYENIRMASCLFIFPKISSESAFVLNVPCVSNLPGITRQCIV